MKLRKFFNNPNKEQKELIQYQINEILIKIEDIFNSELSEQKEMEIRHNSVCPKCDNNEKTIVDKISNVNGNIIIEKNVRFGFRKIHNKIVINTSAVNHCNICGNEWIKYKAKTITKEKILRTALMYLNEIIKDPAQKKYLWKVEVINNFNGCYAETIYELNKTKNGVYFSDLNIDLLRKYYKSVFDV